jgi:hypothetical protein
VFQGQDRKVCFPAQPRWVEANDRKPPISADRAAVRAMPGKVHKEKVQPQRLSGRGSFRKRRPRIAPARS